MNIFSNIGITELIVILLLALLVVGPERLPELARNFAKMLRNVRKAYENLSQDLGPELMSFQETTREIQESVKSVRSIPEDMVKSVVKAADLEDTIAELKDVTGSIEQVGQSVSDARKIVKQPVGAALSAARDSLLPTGPAEPEDKEANKEAEEAAAMDIPPQEQAGE
jgi:sec-independent protein translocase protein TatB